MSVTDYEKAPTPSKVDTDYTKLPPDRKMRLSSEEERELLSTWVDRKNEAEEDRKQYLTQIKVNRKFAAGKQHLDVNTRDGRVLDVRERNGIKLETCDVLSQYLLTVLGRMANNDYRPNFLVSQDNELADNVAQAINSGFGWGWENEWYGDKKVLQILRLLVTDGIAGVRVKYDRQFGEILGEDIPFHHETGEPLFGDEEVQYRAESFATGRKVKEGVLREGKVVLEILSIENILAPPGFENPEDFPWEVISRAAHTDDVNSRYGVELEAEEIESPGQLTAGLGMNEGQKSAKLKNRVMVYTGYERPCSKYPRGLTVVFTQDHLLDYRDHLPFDDHPRGPSTGVHYFRWQTISGRFIGRGFIEGGLGPQKTINKRITQIGAIIDRNMPKVYIEENSLARPRTGEPNEIIEVRPGAPLPNTVQGTPPGGWMLQDIKLQQELLENALGLRPVTMGAPPQGVTAYSALALMTENDSLKLDPIAQDFRLGMVEVSWDCMEAMRNWPKGKKLLIAGPESTLEEFIWDSNMIPYRYLVRPPRGGALPRTQAAELQKINDLWNASGGLNGRLGFEWYAESMEQGKAQEIPPSLSDSQLHRAELENIVIVSTGQPTPVAEYDDDAKHVEVHRSFQTNLQTAADMGDENAMTLVQAFEAHIQEHEQNATNKRGVGSMPQDVTTPPQQGFRPPGPPEGTPNDSSLPPLPRIPQP